MYTTRMWKKFNLSWHLAFPFYLVVNYYYICSVLHYGATIQTFVCILGPLDRNDVTSLRLERDRMSLEANFARERLDSLLKDTELQVLLLLLFFVLVMLHCSEWTFSILHQLYLCKHNFLLSFPCMVHILDIADSFFQLHPHYSHLSHLLNVNMCVEFVTSIRKLFLCF